MSPMWMSAVRFETHFNMLPSGTEARKIHDPMLRVVVQSIVEKIREVNSAALKIAVKNYYCYYYVRTKSDLRQIFR